MTSCPYCDGPCSALGVRLGFRIGRCGTCGSVVCLDDVGAEVLAALYGDPGYYTGQRAPYGYDGDLDRNDVQRTPVWERRLVAMAGVTAGRRLLELGPGRGGFLRLAEARGWQVAAVDPYPVAALPGVLFPTIDDAAAAGSYDAICLFDVLEHVQDPGRLLDRVHRLLAAGGCVAIGLPNVDGPSFRSQGVEWCEVKPPEHLSLPSVDGLRRASARAGFDIVNVTGHLRETWLWEPIRGLIDPRSARTAVRKLTRFGARVVNRALREVRTRLPAPPPERQDYVTWLLAKSAGAL